VADYLGVPPRLWISYSWTGKEERDFSYLLPQIKERKIEAIYNSLPVESHVKLSQRIVQRLLSINFDGWLYILTHQVISRRACTDELIASIDQAASHLGPAFPMLGLLHGIDARNVPTALKLRPCLAAGDPEWCRLLFASLKQPAVIKKEVVSHNTRFVWKIHSSYDGNPSMTAVEVGLKTESIQYWRFAVPQSAEVTSWGVGVAGGGEISPIRFAVAKGSTKYSGQNISWFGAANAVSPTESAYVVFSGPIPEFVCFGPAESPFGPPAQMEVLRAGFMHPPIVHRS
jgi:hypothetical protein